MNNPHQAVKYLLRKGEKTINEISDVFPSRSRLLDVLEALSRMHRSGEIVTRMERDLTFYRLSDATHDIAEPYAINARLSAIKTDIEQLMTDADDLGYTNLLVPLSGAFSHIKHAEIKYQGQTNDQ